MSESLVARALAVAAARAGAAAGLALMAGRDAAAARGVLAAGGAGLEAMRAELGEARPRGWRQIDPSWIEHALAGADALVRAIVLGDRDDPTARWLARWFLGGLVPMPVGEAGRGDAVDDLPRLGAAAIVRVLDAIGRRQLAHAIADASRAEHVALAARLPWGRTLDGELAAVRSLGGAVAAQLGARRSAAARTSGLAWTDAATPMRAGLRAIAPLVRDRGDLAAQLAQRLPRAIGVTALAELRGPFASAPADTISLDELARALGR